MALRHQKSVKKGLGMSNLGQMSVKGKVLTLAKTSRHIYLSVSTPKFLYEDVCACIC